MENKSFLNKLKAMTQIKFSSGWIIGLIGAFLVIVLGLAAYLYVREKDKNADKSGTEASNDKIKSLLPKTDCAKYANDNAASLQAVNDGSVLLCECVKDTKLKEGCIKDATQSSYQYEAQRQCDPSICKKISNAQQAKYCEEGIKQYVSQMDKNQLAVCLMGAGNYNDSIKAYEQRLSGDANNFDNLISLAMAYANKGLMERKESEYVPKALELIDKAEKLQPDNPEAYRARGFVFEIKPDYTNSITSYNKAIEKDSTYIPAFIGRGHVHSLVGIVSKALEDYRKAKELDKDNKFPEIDSYICTLAAKIPSEANLAISSCKKVVDNGSAVAIMKMSAYAILGDLFAQMKDYNSAEAYYKQAENINNQDATLLATIARYYNDRNNYKNASVYAERAIKADSKKSAGYYNFAKALYNLSDNARAIEYADKGLEVVKDDVSLVGLGRDMMQRDLYYLLSLIYGKQGNTEKKNEYKAKGDEVMVKVQKGN